MTSSDVNSSSDEWTLADGPKEFDMSPEVTDSESPALPRPLSVKVALAYPAVPMEATSVQAVLSLLSPQIGSFERSSLHLVAVIDNSGSMGGQKLRLVKQTMLFVLQHLSDHDALAVVTFDTKVQVHAPLTACDKEGREHLAKRLKGIEAGSQTNLSGGLLRGIELHREGVRRLGPDVATSRQAVVRSTFLLTDGMANVGIVNHDNIQAAGAAALAELGDMQCTLSTFGFGSDHSGDLLRDLSELGQGIYSYIESQDGIGDAFGEALGGLLSTTHQNVRLVLELNPGVVVEKMQTALPVEGPCMSSSGLNCITIDMGDVFAEERRDVLITLSLTEATLAGCWTLGSLRARGFSVLSERFEETSATAVKIERRANASEACLPINPLIELQQNRFLAMEALESARNVARSGDLSRAREGLMAARHDLEASPLCAKGDATTVGLLADVKNCLADLRDDASYRARASKTLACTSASHSKQRPCSYSELYSTPTCRAMKASFKKHVTFDDESPALKRSDATNVETKLNVGFMPFIHKSSQWPLPQRYSVKQFIGTGAYGAVCEAYDSDKQELVAIKRMSHVFEDLDDCKRVLREISLLSRLQHPHIVAISNIVVPEDASTFQELFIVMEICDSDLKKLCRTDVNLESIHINSLMYNLLVGLKYIHSAGVYHRDLKPANCLVNQDCSVKICDFGLARAVGQDEEQDVRPEMSEQAKENCGIPVVPGTARLKRHLTGHVVTQWYRPPELLLMEKNYTEAIDVWGAGCIFAELLQMVVGTKTEDRGPLFPGSSLHAMSPRSWSSKKHTQIGTILEILGRPTEEEIEKFEHADARRVLRGFGKSSAGGLREKCVQADTNSLDLLHEMLQFMPDKRITAAAVLEHELFKECRDISKETCAPEKIKMALEDEANLDEAALRRYFALEFQKYNL